ncbi:alpha-ketoglutarate-dependent dioxygenase AlkB [Sphingomonas immobilis]|uniref:Alpha-ketoglutarate-dependent dioxygenase AlkB n=1 Tax=Sphingomonas immobilis TaxID=3063997 RepID=A0ABT8ZXA4_9SPHN|nr:alpha-ketoglutarate-dependent dioxygenase AlkB [Sphingomonas sp. CA1-15]MDO7841923.1 alpha-ketoglutarate-dependent dioxygenase AlkB [Sphingomonas sp. CA1-15]
MTRDLFGLAVVPGFESVSEIVTPEQERALITQIDACALEPFRFQRWLGKRLTASFGVGYDFARGRVEAADPLPDWLLPIRARAAAFARLAPEALVQALVIRYDPGAGIGWHRDRPVYEHVVGLSLGAPAILRLRRRKPGHFERRSAPLEPRALYRLSGEARHIWEHSIVEMTQTRWSITFRSMADGVRAPDPR